MDLGLIIIIILLIIYCGFKDFQHSRHLERLELRLKGIEPTDFDSVKKNQQEEVVEDNLTDLSNVDPELIAKSLKERRI